MPLRRVDGLRYSLPPRGDVPVKGSVETSGPEIVDLGEGWSFASGYGQPPRGRQTAGFDPKRQSRCGSFQNAVAAEFGQ